jgi:hypothetical protein
MACPQCGCLLLSPDRSRQHNLVCTDCGHPMDAQLRSCERPGRWHDRASLALLLAVASCVVGLAFSTGEGVRSMPAQSLVEGSRQASPASE